MKTLPENLESVGVVMSNYDYIVKPDAEERLKEGDIFGEYTAWNFWAAVWFDDPDFQCAVKQYKKHVSTFTASTLEEVMETASERYGWD